MSYATATQIASEFKSTTFSGSSAVTTSELDDWCDEFSRVIDAQLSAKYTVPITGTESLKIVRLIVKNFVAARVKRILSADEQAGGRSKETDADKLEKQAQMMLDNLSGCGDCDMTLPDATANTARQSPKSFQQANNIQPVWEKGVDQY